MTVGVTFFGVFANVYVFLTIMIMIGGVIGAISGKLSVSVFSSFLIYSYIALKGDLVFFTNLMYVFLSVIIFFIGFNTWKYFSEAEST